MIENSDKMMRQLRFKRWLGPVLDALRSLGGSGTKKEVIDQIARELDLPEKILNEVRNSSGEPRFPSQVSFACLYLKKEGLISSPKRGTWNLSDKGRSTHLSIPDAIEIVSRWDKIFRAKTG